MSAIDLAARLAGVSQKTIDEVEAALPHTAKLLQIFKDNEDLIKQAPPLIAQALAFYAKLAPLIAPVLAEIDAVTPAAQDVISFLQKQQAKSDQIAVPDSPNVGA